jgi:GntR family transcriptional regulator of arabinose operon
MYRLLAISRESSLPLHRQLLNELRHAIISGELKPHDHLPGELELVNQLGISRATVRRAWEAAVEEGLLYRVAGKGTYVSDVHVSRPRRRVVGFLVPGFHSAFDSQLLGGADSVLRAQGYGVLFACTERDVEEENRLLKEMCADGMAGLLVWPAIGQAANGRYLATAQSKLPIVLMDRPLPGLSLPCVTSHNYMGGTLATQHLLSLGHREIAFLASPLLDLWPIAERFRAYQETMRSVGLGPLPPVLIGPREEIRVDAVRHSIAETYAAEIAELAGVLGRPDRPTAIFAVNDLMALLTVIAADRAGLRVPHDLSVVGFDNLSLVEHFAPPLTTVAQDPFSIGAEAARRLLIMVEGEPVQDIWTLLPTRLVVRASTAPPPEGR